MDYESIVVGVMSSIVSSFLFVGLMFTMRPKLVISDLIARTSFDGKKVFIIKIINNSWWKLYDIHTELTHLRLENVTGGQNVRSKHLALLTNHLWSVNSLHGWRRDINAEYAVLCVCLDDLDVLWTNNSMLEFCVIAKHSFSGFNRLVKKRFYRAQTAIKDGSFQFGNSMEID